MRALSEPFEISGHWFVPENPNRKVSGVLAYTPQRTELRLLESFEPIQRQLAQGIVERPVIYGKTEKSEAVTVLRAVLDGGSLSFGAAGMSTPENWLCLRTIYGDYVKAEPTFEKMRCRVPGLPVWQSQKLVEHSYQTHDDGHGEYTNYRIHDPPVEKIPLSDSEIESEWFIEITKSLSHFNVAVKIEGWFTIQPRTPQPLAWFLEQQEKMATLLTLLAGTQMLPDALQVPATKPPRQASVLFSRPDVTYCDYKNVHDFFLPRCDLGAEWSEIIQKWWEVWPKITSPGQLAMSIFGSRDLWPHIEFLSWMQALEGLHRALCKGVYMDPAAYEAVKETIVDAIPSEVSSAHRDALKSKIRYGNELSLAKRLKELAERLGEPIRLKIFGVGAKVPRTWIDTRNFYTHWDEALRENILSGQEMMNSNLRLSLFLRCLYLNLVGVPDSALSAALGGVHRASQWLIQINGRERRALAAKGEPGAP